ncbi:MAG TPA: NPCBM/NEW2 domain-containing protein, partial [Arenibacter sp.]|nr:NPCBM/NEW2 domain-containing protein [Arenibacter sp.]
MGYLKIFVSKFLLLSFITVYPQSSGAGIQLLSELDIESIEQPWWPAKKDMAITGSPIQIAGKSYKKGIGTLPGSKLYFFLDGKGKVFKAELGIQDQQAFPKNVQFNALGDGSKLFYAEKDGARTFVGIANSEDSMGKGSARFFIKGDGKTLWTSKKISGGDKAVTVTLDVKNVKVLELGVGDNGDGLSGDHAIWAEPTISYTEFIPQLVDGNYLNRLDAQDQNYSKTILPKVQRLPKGTEEYQKGVKKDWLVEKVTLPSKVYQQADGKEIVISNGLISRTFRLTPNCTTVGLTNLVNGESLLRGVSPEATLTIDGQEYAVGGLEGQIEYGYLKEEWLDQMWSTPGSFQLTDFKIDEIQERIQWPNKRWSLIDKGPTKGKHISFSYSHPQFQEVAVKVHYNIYDGIPMISKWFTIENKGTRAIVLNSFKSEILAMVEAESAVEKQKGWETPNIHIESDFAFHSMSMKNANKVVHWEKDPRYTSQASYLLSTPCLLECKLPIGPDQTIDPGASFESFRIWELPMDSYDRQRNGLYTNAMYAQIAPWVTENPMFLHLTTTDDAKVKAAIDQCVATGYEMVIL